jgi:alpha-tubulin suppressor-like RCC1 family protein
LSESEEAKITDIFGGWNHSFFITQDKKIFAFGSGIYGELGQGKSESSNKPV